jgi:transcriptional regulator with XRE-family HTH domain
MNIKEKLIKLRKDNNLTQEELADKLYVSRQTVSNWENGKFYPDIETLILISNTFNISLDTLLKNDIKMVKNIDNKVKSHKKLLLIIILLIIIFIISMGCFYKYHKDHKVIIRKVFTEVPENSSIITINKQNITNDNINYYIDKNVDIYVDDHDIDIKETKPISRNSKLIRYENNKITFIVTDNEFRDLNSYLINGYNLQIELSK